jgi:hypothetical protein
MPSCEEEDPLLDDFMPVYEIVERHRIRVNAPPDVVLKAARDLDLFGSPIVRSVFRTRELVSRAKRDTVTRQAGLIDLAMSLGWGVLAEAPGREIVMGAVTQPWKANVVFQSVSPDRFREFTTPGYVKIAWTVRADSLGEQNSIFRSETRAVATDARARARFRRYWTFISPGVWLIRRLMLRPVKRGAEHQFVLPARRRTAV